MIPSSAASVEAYWELPLVPPLEQRPVAGRELLSEQRSAGPPGYSVDSRRHHRRRRAPTMATQPTAIRFTDIQHTLIQPMDIQATHRRPMGIRATRVLMVIPARTPMGIKAARDTRVTPLLQSMDHRKTWHPLFIPVPRATNIRALRPILRRPVPLTDLPPMAIPAIAPSGIGGLGRVLYPSPQAEFHRDFPIALHEQAAGIWVVARSFHASGINRALET